MKKMKPHDIIKRVHLIPIEDMKGFYKYFRENPDHEFIHEFIANLKSGQKFVINGKEIDTNFDLKVKYKSFIENHFINLSLSFFRMRRMNTKVTFDSAEMGQYQFLNPLEWFFCFLNLDQNVIHEIENNYTYDIFWDVFYRYKKEIQDKKELEELKSRKYKDIPKKPGRASTVTKKMIIDLAAKIEENRKRNDKTTTQIFKEVSMGNDPSFLRKFFSTYICKHPYISEKYVEFNERSKFILKKPSQNEVVGRMFKILNELNQDDFLLIWTKYKEGQKDI